MIPRENRFSGTCTALVPFVSRKTAFEVLCDEIARRSLERAKYATRHLSPSMPKDSAYGKFSVVSSMETPPKALLTDSSLGVDILNSTFRTSHSPLVIFSHGYTTTPIKYRPLLEELADKGCAVLSLTHPSSVEEKDGLSLMEEVEYTDKLATTMAHNIQYVLDQIRKGAIEGIEPTSKIILAGHSIGGAASTMVTRMNASVAGCINLDGFLKGCNKTDAVLQPLLTITGDTEKYRESFEEDVDNPEKDIREYVRASLKSIEDYDSLHRNSKRSIKVSIPGASHMDFTDQPFQDFLQNKKSFSAAMRVHMIATSALLTFIHSV